jgi:AAA+ superfamily predicted ATPase
MNKEFFKGLNITPNNDEISLCEVYSFEVTHIGEEIILTDWEENELVAHVELEQDIIEELYHQEMPPYVRPTYNIKSIKISGRDIKELKMSDDIRKALTEEAEKYRDEMIEQIGLTDE